VRSAGRSVSLGGVAAAAAFLEAAAALTPDPAQRARRSLAAAQAKATAGAFGAALALLAEAEAGPLDEAGRARIDLLRTQISYNSGHISEALPLLLAAARRLEPLEPGLARGTYLNALLAALFAGRLRPQVVKAAVPRGSPVLLTGAMRPPGVRPLPCEPAGNAQGGSHELHRNAKSEPRRGCRER
jgi:hypothetical protein